MGTNWPKPGINHVGEYQYTGRLSDEMTPLEVESTSKSE